MTRLGPGDTQLISGFRQFGHHGEVRALLDSMEYSKSTNGPGARQKWLVKDLSGPIEWALAIATSATGIPRIGALFFGTTGPAVTRVTAAMMEKSQTQAVVTVTWGPIPAGPGGPIEPPVVDADATIEVSSTVQAGTTKHDYLGNALWLSQNFDWDDNGEAIIDKRFSEWKEVEVQRPMHVVRFTGLRSESPGAVAARYVGFTNSEVIFGDQPGMWLCTEMTGTSDDGETWQTTIELQRAPELIPLDPQGFAILDPLPGGAGETQLGWDAVIALESQFLDDNVLTPQNYKQSPTTNEVGIKVARVQGRVDFRQLTGLSVHFGPLP